MNQEMTSPQNPDQTDTPPKANSLLVILAAFLGYPFGRILLARVASTARSSSQLIVYAIFTALLLLILERVCNRTIPRIASYTSTFLVGAIATMAIFLGLSFIGLIVL
jgi:hypothetical protein